MNWATILTRKGIERHWSSMAEHWPSMACGCRSWWESRTPVELRGQLAGAWDANDMETYVLARSYIELEKAA